MSEDFDRLKTRKDMLVGRERQRIIDEASRTSQRSPEELAEQQEHADVCLGAVTQWRQSNFIQNYIVAPLKAEIESLRSQLREAQEKHCEQCAERAANPNDYYEDYLQRCHELDQAKTALREAQGEVERLRYVVSDFRRVVSQRETELTALRDENEQLRTTLRTRSYCKSCRCGSLPVEGWHYHTNGADKTMCAEPELAKLLTTITTETEGK